MEETKIIELQKLIEKNATREFQIMKNSKSKTKTIEVKKPLSAKEIMELKTSGAWNAESAFNYLLNNGVPAHTIGEDVKGFQAMTELDLRGFDLYEIDLSFCPNLEEILLCDNNLEQVDLSKNTHLRVINLAGNSLSEFDLTNNFAVERLDVSNNPKLATLNISHCQSLRDVFFHNTKIALLDFTKNSEITTVDGSDTPIHEADLSNCPKVSQVFFYNSALTKINFAKNTKLTILDIKNSLIKALDISKITVKTALLNRTLLTELTCTDEQVDLIIESDDEQIGMISVSNLSKINLL